MSHVDEMRRWIATCSPPRPCNFQQFRTKTPRIRVVRWWLQQVAQIHGSLSCVVEEFVSPWTPVPQEIVDEVRTTRQFRGYRWTAFIPSDFGPVEEWDTSRITNMSELFEGHTMFDVDISRWDTSNVRNMHRMFDGCLMFNGEISRWNTSNVRNMDQMFLRAMKFNQDISGWDVGQVTSMYGMFASAWDFNQPIGRWNVSNVTNMSTMFMGSNAFNQPLDMWVVSGETNTNLMFYDAEHFDHCFSPIVIN